MPAVMKNSHGSNRVSPDRICCPEGETLMSATHPFLQLEVTLLWNRGRISMLLNLWTINDWKSSIDCTIDIVDGNIPVQPTLAHVL